MLDDEISLELFKDFKRYQNVTKCWRKIDGQWAKEKGAKKLYISAHSSVETQSFYKALGCIEAEEYN